MWIHRYFICIWYFFCVLCLNTYVSSRKLPVYLRDLKCPIDPSFDSCFVVKGNEALPMVARGDPEYGIPKLTPLKLPFVSFVNTPSLVVNLTNVEIHGLDKLKIKRHKIELEKGKFTAYLKGDNITVVGDYSADGRILIMPLKGEGRFSMYLKNGFYITEHANKIIEKNGEKYLKHLGSIFHAKFERIVFHLDNLFEGNKQLGDNLNVFLNENWQELIDDFGPSIGDAISKNIDNIFQKFTEDIPMSEIFL